MSQTTTAATLEFDDAALANQLFGAHNANLSLIAEKSGVRLDTRGSTVTVEAEDPRVRETVLNLLAQLYGLLKSGHPVYPRDMAYAYGMLDRDPSADLRRIFRDAVFVVSPRKTITPKTLSQRDYVAALRENDMVFAVGRRAPARPILPWPWPFPCCWPRRSSASSSPGPPWRREKSWASCPATWWRR